MGLFRDHDYSDVDRRNHEDHGVHVRGRDPQGLQTREGQEVHGYVLLSFRSVHHGGLDHDREDHGHKIRVVQSVVLEVWVREKGGLRHLVVKRVVVCSSHQCHHILVE